MAGITRREVLVASAGLAAGAAAPGAARARPGPFPAPGGYRPVVVPNGSTLPWTMKGGVKVFRLVAEPVLREVVPGLSVQCWGYNGETPGPLIELVEGDRCRFYVTNRLPEPTTVHWHGLFIPNGMDGVSSLTQPAIRPGETFRYEFTVVQHGTFMYHAHYDEMTQIGLGLQGMIVVHPRGDPDRVDRDFSIMLNEWAVAVGTSRPDPNSMDGFNVLTMNGVSFPKTEALVVKKGDRVRIRLGNLSAMDHHPIHLHGHAFKVAGTDGGAIPAAAQWPETAVLVPVGSVRWVEFTAALPGDWPLHCHMTHHVMTQMSHGLPNMLGMDAAGLDAKVRELLPGYMTMGHRGMGGMAEMGMPVPKNSAPMSGGPGPFGYIDMGGMFTVLKVREGLTSYQDPGWYQHPAGTVARRASAEELVADGVDPES